VPVFSMYACRLVLLSAVVDNSNLSIRLDSCPFLLWMHAA
jgi:hypothetical protein